MQVLELERVSSKLLLSPCTIGLAYVIPTVIVCRGLVKLTRDSLCNKISIL